MSTTEERGGAGPHGDEPTRPSDEMESYAGGSIQARHGTIPVWLLAVYAVLFLWALYYLYTQWGGLGPGLGI